VKFAFIAKNASKQLDVVFMCRMLDVSTSGYYASRTRRISQRQREDLELVPLIHAEFRSHPRGCGSRMVLGALRHRGVATSRKRVCRLMAEEKLRPRLKRRFIRTTHSDHDRQVAKNIVNRNFSVGKPNTAWASDFTYIHTKSGWAYLAVVLDLGSRKVVGWSVDSTMEERLVLRALDQALRERRPQGNLVHHSDRGVQYASNAYQKRLAQHGIVCSMSRKGNCWDNACVESFFSTLKRELPNDHVFQDVADAERTLFKYIEGYYNTRRPHSALEYRAPAAHERLVT